MTTSAQGSTPSADLTGPLRGTGTPMEEAVLGALDNLERALHLEPLSDNRFRAHNEAGRFGRVFGGQLLAQAMHAATATVSEHLPHSLHAYFVQSGDSALPLDIVVERVRDGRSMAARQVTVIQQGRNLLTAIASFHTNPAEPELAQPQLSVPPPEETTAAAALGAIRPSGDAPDRADLDRHSAASGDADRGAAHVSGRCAGGRTAIALDAPAARHR